jgi:hypothetical protein
MMKEIRNDTQFILGNLMKEYYICTCALYTYIEA